jgi:hypothetical protein
VIFSLFRSPTTSKENDSNITKVNRLIFRMGDIQVNHLQVNVSLLYSSESQLLSASRQVNSEMILIFRQIAPLWEDYIQEVKRANDSTINLFFRLIGFNYTDDDNVSPSGLESSDSADELIDQFADRLDAAPLKRAMDKRWSFRRRFVRNIESAQIFESQVRSRATAMEGLEYFLQYGTTRGVEMFQFTLLRQYVLKKDWQGLRKHLEAIWIEDRSLSLEQISCDRLHIVG